MKLVTLFIGLLFLSIETYSAISSSASCRRAGGKWNSLQRKCYKSNYRSYKKKNYNRSRYTNSRSRYKSNYSNSRYKKNKYNSRYKRNKYNSRYKKKTYSNYNNRYKKKKYNSRYNNRYKKKTYTNYNSKYKSNSRSTASTKKKLRSVSNTNYCIKTWTKGKKTYYKNTCSKRVFMAYCATGSKVSGKRCGDINKDGNKYYTHSKNLSAGQQGYFWQMKGLRYASCPGRVSFSLNGKLTSSRSGNFTCYSKN